MSAKMTYILAYRAIRAYHSGHATVNPLTALRTMQETVPFSVDARTEHTILLAQTSFKQHYMAPKGVHECTYKFVPGAKITQLQKAMQGLSTLRYKENLDKVPGWLHIARINANARQIVADYHRFMNQQPGYRLKVPTISRIERLMFLSDTLRASSDLPLAA